MLAEGELQKLDFPQFQAPPRQLIFNIDGSCTLLVFPTGKCRLMGVKSPLHDITHLPVKIDKLTIQSMTLVHSLDNDINLLRLAKNLPPNERLYEPELFPAVRLLKYNPMCVNVFGSGKVVILGLKNIAYQEFLNDVIMYINRYAT